MADKEDLEEIEDEVEDAADEEVAEETADDEFEYDEDGNIIIPDVVEDEDEADEDAEEPEDTEDETEETDETKTEEAQAEEPAEADERDTKIAELEKKLAALEKQGKETLKKLGVKGDDVLEGLEQVAAETENVSIDEYRKQKAAQDKSAEAEKAMKQTAFAAKMQSDLEEVQKFYPETKKYKSITEIPNFDEFAKLSDKGLSPRQAYIAANPDSVQQTVAASVKQKSLNDTKAHLKSAVPKSSKDNSVSIPRSELKNWRELFPDKSDKELIALYKQSL